MSWRSHGTSNASMVAALCKNGLINNTRVRHAFLAVDRWALSLALQPKWSRAGALYVSPHYGCDAYLDSPSPIGYGQTISAPHMHAQCTELLAEHLVPGARVLDVGHGSGYLCAVFAQLVGPTGRVVGIELVPELVARATTSMSARQASPAEQRHTLPDCGCDDAARPLV